VLQSHGRERKHTNYEQTSKGGGDLTAHLARAADNVCAAFGAVLAAFEAQETLECTKEAVFSSSSSTNTLSMVLLVVLTVVSRSRVHDAHLDSLGLVGGGLSSGVHVDVEWVMEEVRERSRGPGSVVIVKTLYGVPSPTAPTTRAK
jgi:hypothetical protein